jgi:putative tryptophan/tyrosine transport system substrate-binding protein
MKPIRLSFRTPRSGDPESRSTHRTCCWIPGSRAPLAPRNDRSRREFLTLLGGAAAAWPLTARAQKTAMPVVGFLNGAAAENYVRFANEFRRGLNGMGFIEGQNVTVEYRWAEGHYERLPELAADLIRRGVTVIAATSTPAALAAKAATTTIPIVFTTASDPVSLGLVANLARPGGNMTGATQLNMELGPKRFELIHQLLPKATTIALLVNPANPPVAAVQSRDAQEAVRALGLQLQILEASTEAEIEKVITGLPKGTGGLIIGSGDSFFLSQTAQFAAITVRQAVPTISNGREFTAAGGLLSYGGSVADSYLLAGVYTGRILNGEKPAELPVQRSSKVEMFINLKTAKALGITVPPGLVIAADEVFE